MDNKKALEKFGFRFCNYLLEEGATYASIILSHNNNVLYNYSTNIMWDVLYHETGFSKSCHLIQATKVMSKKADNFVLFWDAQTPNNEISIFLNEKRKEKNICHGVSFCATNQNGVLEILTIAGRYCDLNFSSQVISHREEIKKSIIYHREKHIIGKAY
jgi:hypothetical protein